MRRTTGARCALQGSQLPAALGRVAGMEPLVLAALRGCRDAAERSAVWTAVRCAADELSCLCEPDHQEVRCHKGGFHIPVRPGSSMEAMTCTPPSHPYQEVSRHSAQVDDTRAAALQEALTQSMLECMSLHAEAETRAGAVTFCHMMRWQQPFPAVLFSCSM